MTGTKEKRIVKEKAKLKSSDGIRILRSACDGDTEAQMKLIDNFEGFLMRMSTCKYYEGGRCVERVDDDIKQELRLVCLKVIEHFKLKELEDDPVGWLLQRNAKKGAEKPFKM